MRYYNSRFYHEIKPDEVGGLILVSESLTKDLAKARKIANEFVEQSDNYLKLACGDIVQIEMGMRIDLVHRGKYYTLIT